MGKGKQRSEPKRKKERRVAENKYEKFSRAEERRKEFEERHLGGLETETQQTLNSASLRAHYHLSKQRENKKGDYVKYIKPEDQEEINRIRAEYPPLFAD